MRRTLKLRIEERIGLALLGKVIHLQTFEELSGLRCCFLEPQYCRKIRIVKDKERMLCEPSRPLKRIQKLILEFILSEFPVSKFAHAGTFRRSVVSNAEKHIFGKSFFKIDFKDTFPSITPQIVRDALTRRLEEYSGYFKKYSVSSLQEIKYLSFVITRLTTFEGFLPQGAPTSLSILNLVLFDLDNVLGGIAERRGLIYTRYADDICFSSSRGEIPEEVRQEIILAIKKTIPLKFNRN